MAHQIDNMAYVGETPWHGLGTELNEHATLEQWITDAGFDWTVESSPIYYNGNGQAQISKAHQVFYRSDRPDVVLGVGSDKFKESQPREYIEFMYQFGEETGAKIHTAGSLNEGRKFWVLIKHTEAREIFPGDGKTDDFILSASANDGTMASVFGPCRTRVVCNNTLQVALRDGLDKLRISHRSKVDWKEVRAWLRNESDDFQLYTDLMSELANIPVDAKQAVEFSAELIAPDWDPSKKRPRSLNRFLDTLQHGKGQKEAGRNAYGLINAVTRYVDHEKQARGQESRLNSAWFGPGQTLKQQGFDLLLKNCVEKWGERSKLQPVLTETKYAELVA